MDAPTVLEIIAASVAPAVLISAEGLMLVAFISRHTTLTGRLRSLHEEALHFTDKALHEDCDYFRTRAHLAFDQSKAVFERVKVVTTILRLLFLSQFMFLLTCAFLGVGVVYTLGFFLAILCFGLGILFLCVAVWKSFFGIGHSVTAINDEENTTKRLLEKLEQKHKR